LFERGGYRATTIEAVAARSRVAKTTIYRRWPNRAALLVELLLQVVDADSPPTGPEPLRALRKDLRQVAEALEALPGRLVASLLSEAHHDPGIRVLLLEGLFDARRDARARLIQLAQQAGAIRRDVPPLLAADLLVGPLLYRKFVRQDTVTVRQAGQVFEAVLEGLATRPRGRR
jgi:AcrR family transcriptional regulator